jgi:hypothetical protein
MGGGFGGTHMGGGFGGRGFESQHFAGTRGHFDRDRRFDRERRFGRGFGFGPGWDYGLNDYGCGYGYPYYNRYNCYLPTY